MEIQTFPVTQILREMNFSNLSKLENLKLDYVRELHIVRGHSKFDKIDLTKKLRCKKISNFRTVCQIPLIALLRFFNGEMQCSEGFFMLRCPSGFFGEDFKVSQCEVASFHLSGDIISLLERLISPWNQMFKKSELVKSRGGSSQDYFFLRNHFVFLFL